MKNKENSSPCIWKENNDFNYDTSCDKEYVPYYDLCLEHGNYKFCPYCGGHIVEVDNE